MPANSPENELRHMGGQAGYSGSFVDRYVVSILYPDELTPTTQILLGIFVLAINLAIYWHVFRKSFSGSSRQSSP